jgi:hypothetical protein
MIHVLREHRAANLHNGETTGHIRVDDCIGGQIKSELRPASGDGLCTFLVGGQFDRGEHVVWANPVRSPDRTGIKEALRFAIRVCRDNHVAAGFDCRSVRRPGAARYAGAAND